MTRNPVIIPQSMMDLSCFSCDIIRSFSFLGARGDTSMTLCGRIVGFSPRIIRSGILGNICENGLSAGSCGNGQDEAYFS